MGAMVSDFDIVVGIDFGMTATAVSYSAGPDWGRPETIQNWPSLVGSTVADKVDTKLVYDQNDRLVSWGFLIDDDALDDNHRQEELFKLYMDPAFKDQYEENPPSFRQARKWFTDYLSCIYSTVERRLYDTIPRFSQKRVNFCFSVPTTWKNPGMIVEIEHLLRDAGFGKENSLHRAEITLTEAEAAALYASKQQYSAGDVFLVCDAGGGTTDVNILKVVSTSGAAQTELEPLNFVEGAAIGSVLIDIRIEKLVTSRLMLIKRLLQAEPEETGQRMMKEGARFENFKRNLGSTVRDLPALRLPIPGLASNVVFEEAGIENGCMIITKQEIEAEFDHQIRKIITLIDGQLSILESTRPGEKLTYLVLSGGLGSSPFLHSKLQAYYASGRPSFPLAQDVQILQVPKPQLAVCHGLVLDKVQQVNRNRLVYKNRICRASYGIVCRRLYDPNVHYAASVSVDPGDGKKWAERQIDWLIVQGQKISVQEGVKQHYSLKVPPDEKNVLWKTEVVISSLPSRQLPSSLDQSGARLLCVVESRLPTNMTQKNRRWYSRGQRYMLAEFDMRVIVGAADLKFQTVSSNSILGQNKEEITVEWVTSESETVGDVVLGTATPMGAVELSADRNDMRGSRQELPVAAGRWRQLYKH